MGKRKEGEPRRHTADELANALGALSRRKQAAAVVLEAMQMSGGSAINPGTAFWEKVTGDLDLEPAPFFAISSDIAKAALSQIVPLVGAAETQEQMIGLIGQAIASTWTDGVLAGLLIAREREATEDES